MIIIEGADGTGKTTLAKALEFILAGPKSRLYQHEGVPNDDEAFEYYLERARELPYNVILDRFHLGQMVYPTVKPGRTPLTRWQQHAIERVLMAKGCLLVHAQADASWIRQVFIERGEDYVTEEDIPTLSEGFRRVVKDSMLTTLSWRPQLEEQIEPFYSILNTTKRLEQLTSALRPFGGWGNPFEPRYAVVGAKVDDWAFHEMLDRQPAGPREFYMCGAEGDEILDEIELVNPRAVMALPEAQERMQDLGLMPDLFSPAGVCYAKCS